jgi:serine/threonine protein kinase
MPDASPFLVLELVERGSLAVLLRKSELRTTPVDWNLKVTLLNDIARGMKFIHSLRHMHRDLKVSKSFSSLLDR